VKKDVYLGKYKNYGLAWKLVAALIKCELRAKKYMIKNQYFEKYSTSFVKFEYL